MSFFKKNWTILVLVLIFFLLFKPILISHQIPFSGNLLVSFFNPWAQEKFPGWYQGIPNKPVGIDDLRIFFPQRLFTTEMLKNFQIPFWNPYNFSGNYHAGLSETAVFYPLFFIFLLFPQLSAWIFLQLLEPIIAGFGMYFFLRRIFSSKIPGVFGALVFGLSGVVVVRMVEGLSVGQTLIWLPWVFYGVEAYSIKNKFKYLILTTVFLSFSILAGWFQYTFYIFFIGVVYALFKFNQSGKKTYLLIFVPFLISPIFTLFHLVPSLEALTVSARAIPINELLNNHLMPWYHILSFLNPDLWGNPSSYNFFGKSEYKESILYIGTVPFFLSIFGFNLVLKDKKILFFVFFSILGIVLGMDNPISRFILSLPIPIISTFLPNRIFLLTVFCMSVLSSYGLFYLLEAKKISKLAFFLFALIAGILFFLTNAYAIAADGFPPFIERLFQESLKSLTTLNFTNNFPQTLIFAKNIYLPDIFLIVFMMLFVCLWRKKKAIFIAGIFITTIVGQIYFFQKYVPWSQAEFVFPDHPVFDYLQKNQGIDRFVSLGNGYISSNIPLYFNLYSPDGVSSVYIKRYGEMVTYAQTKGRISNHIPRIEIRIDPTVSSILKDQDKFMLRFMQIDGVKYILMLRNEESTSRIGKYSNKFMPVWQSANWQILEYKEVLPRIFWTNQYLVSQNNINNLREVFNFSKNPKRIVLEKVPALNINNKSTGTVNIALYKPQQILLKTSSTGNGFVFLSDNYSPNFSVFIDGRPSILLRADYTFRAIPVTAGKHIIEIVYRDNKETIAFIISAISIILGILIVKYFQKKSREIL